MAAAAPLLDYVLVFPLFAVGAFLAFTLSQARMVGHWRASRERGRMPAMLINGLGALATGVTLLVVIVAKFAEGAWVMTLLIPTLLAVCVMVARHYRAVAVEIANRHRGHQRAVVPRRLTRATCR